MSAIRFTQVRPRATFVAVFALVLALSTACTDDEPVAETSASPSSSDNPSATPTPSDTKTSEPALPGAGTKEVFIKGDADATALLTAVRIAEQGGFDRFVLEFDGGLPDVAVSYIEPPVIQDGSGDTVQIDGDAFLSIRATPASGVDLTTEDPTPTYTGEKRLNPADTESIEEAVLVDDFEANLTWVLGIDDGRKPFLVSTLTNPTRVVVDIAHR